MIECSGGGTPLIGQAIGHYEVIEKLGEGGMGAVYKARDIHLGRSVAIKVLPGGSVANPERKRRFALEAKAASALNHPERRDPRRAPASKLDLTPPHMEFKGLPRLEVPDPSKTPLV